MITEDSPLLKKGGNTTPVAAQNTAIPSVDPGAEIGTPDEDFGSIHRCIPHSVRKYAGMILTLIASVLFSSAVNLFFLYFQLFNVMMDVQPGFLFVGINCESFEWSCVWIPFICGCILAVLGPNHTSHPTCPYSRI